jgi:HAE1 family hydrophobic/amphiphilic exporter-1
LTAILIVTGCYFGFHSPIEWVPDLELPLVVVSVRWGGASQEALESRITANLEEAVLQSPLVKGVDSTTIPGEVLLRAQCLEEKAGFCASEILARVAALRKSFPAGVELGVTQSLPEALRDEQGFMILQFAASISPASLRRIAENELAPRFLKLPGIRSIEIDGGQERELRTTLDSGQLEVYKASSTRLRSGLAGELQSHGYGTLRMGARQVLLYKMAPRKGTSLGIIPIRDDSTPQGAMLRLADLGRVELGTAPVRTLSRINSKPVVTLTLDRVPGSHLLRVARDVHKVVEEVRNDLPPGGEILIADDRSEDVRKQLRDLVLRGGLSVALVLLILLAMLRSSRAVGITLLVVLVSISAAICLFQPLGLTLNILTIAGLVLLFGLVIDNAVVVIEHLQAELANCRRRGPTAYAAIAGRAVRCVWLPLLGGTLTTCAVFVPMIYLSGELKGLFAPFAVLSALTLGASLVASALLVPRLGYFLRGRVPQRTAATRQTCTYLLLPYCFATRHPRLSVLLLALAIGLPTPLLPDYIEEPSEGWKSEKDRHFADRYNATLGCGRVQELRFWLDPLLGGVTRPFLKNVELGKRWDFDERPEIRVRIQLPPGSDIEHADQRVRPFEQEARTSPAVERTLVNVRGRVATLSILFHDKAMDGEEPYLLRERLIAHALQIAGMEVSISGLVPLGFYSGVGEASGFTIHFLGPSYEKLEEVSQVFARHLKRNPRVAEVDINAVGYRQPPAREVIRFHWSADATARSGISARELAEVLRPRLWREAPDFYANLEGDPRMPVRIVVEGAEKLDLATLLGTPLPAGSDRTVRLEDHAEVSIEKDPPVIERIDQQYRRTLSVYYRGPYHLGKEMLDKEIEWMRLPPGYRLERPKYEFFTDEVKREFLWLILGTTGLVFLIIAAVLENWRLAAVVVLSVPLSWIGMALGFLVTDQNFAEGAFIGVLLAIGIAVNNSILLADAYQRLRQARPGAPVPRLTLLALRQRLRPMWTTTLTSIASMIPLLILPEAGNFWIGLAVTVVGGLLASTLLAPAATIAVLSWASRRWALQRHRATRSHRELIPAG